MFSFLANDSLKPIPLSEMENLVLNRSTNINAKTLEPECITPLAINSERISIKRLCKLYVYSLSNNKSEK